MPGESDVRSVLLQLGMDQSVAEMAVPFMYMMPATTDPYSPNIIMIVNGLQTRLRAMGFKNRGDGFVDKGTAAALNQLAGRNWRSKTWLQICGDVLHKVGAAPRRNTAMGYSSMGALPDTEWCSKENPQGNCSPLVGVVKPMTVETANIFKLVQSETNRVAHMTGTPKVAVDGRIGPATLSGVNAALKKGTALVGFLLPGYPTVEDLARNADVVHVALSEIANSLSAPAVVAGPAPTAPPSGSNGILNPPNAQIKAGMPLMLRLQQSSLFYPGIAALVIGGLYLLNKPKSKGKKSFLGIF